MATENTPVFVKYVGNGTTTEFSVTFPYIKKDYVKVYLKLGDNDQTLLAAGTDYTWIDDTTIQYPADTEATALLTSSDTLAIYRETDLGSDYEFDNQRRLFPEEVMNADDLGFQQIQELARDLDRAIKAPETSSKSADDLWAEFEAGVDAANEANQEAQAILLGIQTTVNTIQTAAAAAATSEANALASEMAAEQAAEEAKAAVATEATETTAGVVKLSTQEQAISGLDDSSAMTPLKTTQAIYNNVGRISELGFNGTLASGVITFETTDSEAYTLQHNYMYQIDLLFEAVGTLDDDIELVVQNGTDTVRIVNVLNNDTTTNITVGDLKQIMKYNTDVGFRWFFNAVYKVTSDGTKVFAMPSTVVKTGTQILSNVSVLTSYWAEDATYTDYPYKASIPVTDALASQVAIVTFDVTEATANTYAPVSQTADGYVYIYASEIPSDTITIPSITLLTGE